MEIYCRKGSLVGRILRKTHKVRQGHSTQSYREKELELRELNYHPSRSGGGFKL